MKMTLKASAALLLAALVTTAPALALANDSAKVVSAMKSDALPIDNVVGMIGSWSTSDLAFLDKAQSVKVFDTRQLYQGADLNKIASAETSKSVQLGKFRDAIRGDKGLAGWFTSNKIDVNRVVAVADPKGNAEIFLY